MAKTHIRMTLRKRGGRKLVVTPDGAPWAPRPRVDNAMVKAPARAFRWRKLLDEGVHGTLEDLALRRRCLTVTADLATVDGPREAAAAALTEHGTIDILVNCAGIARLAPALELSVEAWDETMAVNLRTPFLLAQALAPGMIAQRWGKIINVSSQTGVIATDDHAAYASSKGGLNSLTKSLMAEWARHNVQVNAICPTVIMTPMGRAVWGREEKGGPMRAATPLRRFGETVEIADLALYLASPASQLVNGAIVMIEGGYSSV
jgi:NAD(P)-dependent dehydrogenase (short-subunit alcohol dehydrogenase family)